MQTVFVLQHVNVDGDKNVKLIGVYRSRAAALMAVNRLKQQPGFCDHPEVIHTVIGDAWAGFHINEYSLDTDSWADGYISGDEA